jgi:hypothetical protein
MKKSSRFTGLVLAVMGTMVLLNNLGKPRVEALHGSDVWGLVASGMCLGIGFVGLMGRLVFGSFDSSWVREVLVATDKRRLGIRPLLAPGAAERELFGVLFAQS